MKKLNLLAQKLVLGALALAALGMGLPALADNVPQVVTVYRVSGTARYSTDSKTWHPLKKGDVLNPGCVIQTAPNSQVDVQLGERESTAAASSSNPTSTLYTPEEQKANIVRIFENSALGVDKLILQKNGDDEVSETQLDLRAGQIMGNVKKLSSASKYEVKIPNGVAGVRGTVYMISSSGVVNVLSGSIVIAIVGSDGTVITKIVIARQHYDPATNSIRPLTGAELKNIIELFHHFFPPFLNPPPFHPPPPIIFISPCR